MVDVASPQPQGQAPAPAQPAQAQAQAPETSAAQASQGSQAPGKVEAKKPWMAQLKGHLQTNERLSQFDDFSSVAEKFLEFDGKRERLVEVPGNDATSEQRKEFWKKLGKPEAYSFQRPTALPPGLTFNEAAEKEFATLADSLNLTAEQAQKLFEFDTQRTLNFAAKMQQAQVAAQEAQKKAAQEMRESLMKEWGTKAAENAARAQQAFAAFADKDLAALLTERGLADHPLVAKHFLALAEKIGETGFVPGGTPAAPRSVPLADVSRTMEQLGRK